MLQQKPDQVFLPECRQLSDSQDLLDPLDPVLEGVFMDKLLLGRIGHASAAFIIRLYASDQDLTFLRAEILPELLRQRFQKHTVRCRRPG